MEQTQEQTKAGNCSDSEDDVEIIVTKPEEDEDDEDEVYELSRTPSPVDMMDDTPMMRKKSAQPPRADSNSRSPSPEPREQSPPPVAMQKERSPSPVKERSPSPVKERSPSLVKERSPSPVKERSPSPVKERSPSPISHSAPLEDSRSPTPERKESSHSHGSSSYDEERASSLSPEPPRAIQTPGKETSQTSHTAPTSQSKSALTKIYTEALGDSDSEERKEKVTRSKPASDITQLYTQKLVEKEELASSPKPERKDVKFQRPEGMTNITQLYTAAFSQQKTGEQEKIKPLRSGNIAKLYTGGIGAGAGAFKGKPKDELTNPTKHNLATTMDKAPIQEAYMEVMADKNNTEWAAFLFSGTSLGVTAKGQDFAEFRSHFGPDDRGFGYIKIMTGDEMSKRSKFVFVTWVGPNVSVMKKAKMSTDKALLKEVIQNLSVELQPETAGEFTLEHFKTEVDKAGGARYGTGVAQ